MALTREPLLVLVVTGVLAWAMHSSIAAVLIIATLANAGLVGPLAALAMVLIALSRPGARTPVSVEARYETRAMNHEWG